MRKQLINTLIDRIKSTNLRKLVLIHFFITVVSVLYLYFFLSYLFPFPVHTNHSKLIIALILYFLIFTVLFFLYWILFHEKPLKFQNYWHYIVIAIILSTIVYHLSLAYTPLFPAELNIVMRTPDELGFMHINRENNNGHITSMTEFDFSGEWYYESGLAHHLGKGYGQINFNKSDYVTEELIFHIVFYPKNTSAAVEIEINGYYEDVVVPDRESAGQFFIYTISSPAVEPASAFWQMWVRIFPAMRWITLTLFYLGALILVFDKKLSKTDQALHLILLVITSFLFYNAFVYQNFFINFQKYNRFWFAVILFFTVLVPLFMLRILSHSVKSKYLVILVVFALALGLRLYWIAMVPSAQVSDFGLFHHGAIQLASGEPGLTITKHATFTRLLSIIYRLMPNYDMFNFLNVLFSLLTMFALWMIGKNIDNEEIGILAAYLFAISPSQIGMVTMVCSDILSTTLLSFSVLLLLQFIRRPKMYNLLGSSLVFGAGVAIRAPLIIYSPFLLMAGYPFINSEKTKNLFTWCVVLFLTLGLSAGYLAVKGVVSTVRVDNMIISEERNVIGPLMMGSNINALGRHNVSDEELLQNWDSDQVFSNGLQLVFDRVTQEPLEFMQVLKHKYAHMFGNATYIADVAFLGEDMDYQTFTTNWPYETLSVRNGVALFGQYSHVLILGLAFGISFQNRQRLKVEIILLCLIIICSSLLAYTFFEVQPRYFRPVIPFILLFSASTIQAGCRYIPKFFHEY